MDNIWPLWALPFWTMGVPLIWAVVELLRLPRQRSRGLDVPLRPMARPN